MSEHAVLAPSSAHLWANCSGFLGMAHRISAQDETDEQREGTAAHWVGARVIESLRSTDVPYSPPIAFLGKTTSNGVVITEKMVQGVEVYVSDVATTVQKIGNC